MTKVINNNAFAYDYLSAIYGIKGGYEKALEAAIKALEKNPNLDNARYNLAVSYQKLGFIDKAINSYEGYLKRNPGNFKVYVEVGRLYYKESNYQKAKEYWLKALEISKDYQPAKDALKLLEN